MPAPKLTLPPVSHIDIREGQARLTGRNLKVKMVISRLIHGTGATVDEVMEQYQLSRAEVYAVLSYYYEHQAAIDQFFAEEEAFAQAHIPSMDVLKARRPSTS
jgi:uncharacterized protein (DUF433 family)